MSTAGTGTAIHQGSRGGTLRSLLPLAIVLLVFVAVEWYLLGQDWLLGAWALAAFLAFHGLIHLMFVAPRPSAPTDTGTDYPFDPARSWLVWRVGLGIGPVRGLAVGLSAITTIGFVLAGLATVGLIVPTDWWAGLIVGSSVLSLALFGLMFSPGLALGIAIDLVLLWLVWSAAWTPVAI